MTIHNTSSQSSFAQAPTPSRWVCSLLGLVLIAAGIVVLGDVVLVTVISAVVIGVTAIIAGAFEIFHAFWTKGWGGFAWQIFLGLVYIAFGFVLVSQPVSGALALTYIFGLLLLASGVVRFVLGLRHAGTTDWLMLLSGVFGALAGLVILTGWPMTGLWVLGFLLGVDLIFHGVAWLVFAWQPAVRTA
jgi:uncharacterized membrane protein HdeD (DUF308 family)